MSDINQEKIYSSNTNIEKEDNKENYTINKFPLCPHPPKMNDYEIADILLKEIKRNPISRMNIRIGNLQMSVSNSFGIIMLTTGKSYITLEKVLIHQKKIRINTIIDKSDNNI